MTLFSDKKFGDKLLLICQTNEKSIRDHISRTTQKISFLDEKIRNFEKGEKSRQYVSDSINAKMQEVNKMFEEMEAFVKDSRQTANDVRSLENKVESLDESIRNLTSTLDKYIVAHAKEHEKNKGMFAKIFGR